MRLVRFGAKGAEKPGLLDRQGTIRDLSGVVTDISGSTLTPEGLKRLEAVRADDLPVVVAGTRLGPCVGSVGKLIGIGLNYSDHVAELGRAFPEEPTFFLKATSSLAGPADPIEMPTGSEKTDWEVELGVVIGSPCKAVGADRAMDYVAGFCTAADVSERHYQARNGPTYGKSFDSFGPLGPFLTTRDEIPDPHALRLTCDVDGERRQDGNTGNLIFKVPDIIAYLSRYFTLQSGDVIITGTPGGVGSGRKPQVFLRAGQTVRLEVEGLGVQEHSVRAG
jgi:2,4-diketo-3-deoxy-L-fuconate hydrolase